MLSSWNDTENKKLLTGFIERVTTRGNPDFVPATERIAVFDNDGTQREFAYDRDFKLSPLNEALNVAEEWG